MQVTYFSITIISSTFKDYLFYNSSLKPRNGNHSFYQRSFFFFTCSENTTTEPSTIISLKLFSIPTQAEDPTIIISVSPALSCRFLSTIHPFLHRYVYFFKFTLTLLYTLNWKINLRVTCIETEFNIIVRKIIAKNQHYTFMVEGSNFFSLITYFDHCDSEKIVGQIFYNVFLC